jgi:beta-lactamase superfamily II metal-dependent hydrolase
VEYERADAGSGFIVRQEVSYADSVRLMPDHPLEMYFVDVGQGDPVFIVTPAKRKILIHDGRGNEPCEVTVPRSTAQEG